jgi:hypothetical protein
MGWKTRLRRACSPTWTLHPFNGPQRVLRTSTGLLGRPRLHLNKINGMQPVVANPCNGSTQKVRFVSVVKTLSVSRTRRTGFEVIDCQNASLSFCICLPKFLPRGLNVTFGRCTGGEHLQRCYYLLNVANSVSYSSSILITGISIDAPDDPRRLYDTDGRWRRLARQNQNRSPPRPSFTDCEPSGHQWLKGRSVTYAAESGFPPPPK